MKIIYSLKEFAAKVKELAKGKYYSIRVQYTEHHDGTFRNEFGCYVDGTNWFTADTIEKAIHELNADINHPAPADIDVEIDLPLVHEPIIEETGKP